MTEEQAYGVRPLPGRTVRFRKYDGRSVVGVITDMVACPWSGNVTYFIQAKSGAKHSVQAASVDYVIAGGRTA